MAKPGNEIFKLLQDLRLEKASGKIYKRFEDDYFALDLLRILYDDTVEASFKTELLIVLEEYGYLGISEESIDQLVTSLIDILHQTADVADNWSIVCQILITSTSLLIQLEQLSSALCSTAVKELVAIVTSRVNQPDSHRLRSTACQCLIQLEEFAPGLLLTHYEDISKLARQEKSYMYQDYALLSAKLLSSTARSLDGKTTVILEGNKSLQKQISFEPQEVRQMVAYLVENMPLCSRSGTYRLMESLVYFVKHNPDVSPMVFKPPLLLQMCTMSCVVFHTVLMVQRQFEGEIFNAQEEADLLQRLCIMTDHPSINPLHRLLSSQWAHWYKLDVNGRPQIHESIVKNHRLMFYPSVFDKVDLQLRKLYMTALCGDTSQDTDGKETCILLGSLGCLHKIVWHTGSGVAARALFKALCFIYSYHNNQSFSKDIQRFVRGLISEFAHFIPHSLDFADSIRSLNADGQVYIDTLRLLHQQVVMATEEQIHSCYHFYLLVMKKAAAEREIDQMATLKFMSYLVENAVDINDSGWTLGHSVLDICRNIILCHGTQNYFKELSCLLYSMMTSYGDTDVQDKATFYYSLITKATDKKVQSVLKTSLGDVESMNQAITSLLPGTTEKLSLAKIIQLEEQIFCWERVSVTTSVNRKDNLECQNSAKDSTGVDPIVQYEEDLKSLTVILDVRCKLTLREDTDYERVHAVSIHVEPSDFFHPVQRRHVSCLKKSVSTEVTLQVQPKLPLPQSLCCRAEFCSDSKQTFSCTLTAVSLEFSNLLMPLPWKPEKEVDFTSLWNWVLNRNTGERGSIASVKMFTVGPDKFDQIQNTYLSQFLIPTNADKCYALFLPPENHVLLRCQAQSSNSIVVSLATDLSKLLPHIDKYLNDIMK